ncbi:MAG: hypothetical protein DMG24_13485 [Acidobacteria bacterium]|nr:MAG: hypothetical protein DMG24_13485 [Acidobacteriota bacterium]
MNPLSRRSFLNKAAFTALALGPAAEAGEPGISSSSQPTPGDSNETESTRYGVVRCVAEWAYTSGKAYRDPFNDFELSVIFTDPKGVEQSVPAFWAGDQLWRIRYSPAFPGRYTYRTVSTDTSNPDLHGRRGIMEVAAYSGDNPLRTHGPIRVASDHLHFEHADGTPFFWLGDTWWMGLCHRLRWPEDFQMLAADRVKKGFTVVQIVAGLYPDMPAFDPRGANEAGYPWERDYSRINPHYFDMADARIQELAERGLVPCVVACWGYFLKFMGAAKLKQHWRYLIARWGAYPVVWCLAGEGTMPYYLSTTKDQDVVAQKSGWTEIGRYVRSIDPYHHPVTIHPSLTARDTVDDQAVLDFDMLQTGHSGGKSYPKTLDHVTEELARSPRMPVLVGEVNYEGILDASRQDVQRFVFWASILSGAGGHTYGANGIWQVNTARQPYGPSPYGGCWGGPPWDVAAKLPGSEQIGIAKRLLTRYPWWRLEPHPEWTEPRWSKDNYELPYAAGIPGELRIVFIPVIFTQLKMKSLEPGVVYRAFFFDPRTGDEHPLGDAAADAQGIWQARLLPTFEQWVLVMERKA